MVIVMTLHCFRRCLFVQTSDIAPSSPERCSNYSFDRFFEHSLSSSSIGRYSNLYDCPGALRIPRLFEPRLEVGAPMLMLMADFLSLATTMNLDGRRSSLLRKLTM